MSGAQTSPFLTTNELLAPMAAYDTHANQLLIAQQRQQEVAANNTEVVARAASTLLDPTLYPTEEARAAGWGPIVQQLKANGYAPNAPADYPGLAHLQAAARQGTPSQTQQEWQFNLAANKAYTNATNPPATAATPATSGAPATTGTPSGGATIGQRQNNPGNLTFAGQPGASPGQGNRFAAFPDMPTGVAANADQLALYQTQHGINTVRGAVTRWVGDPKADLTSYIGDVAKAIGVGPDDPVDLTNPDVQAKFIQAQFPHESAGGGYVLNPADVQKGVQMAAANRGRAVQAPGTQIAIAPPGTPPGTPGTPPPYRVASNAPVAPPASTAPAAPLPRDQAVAQAQRTGQAVPVAGVDGLWALPNGNLSSTPPAPAATPQPQAQGPQPPANRVMPGSADGPPAVSQPPAPSAPAGGPQPPQMAPVNARGLNLQQQAAINAMAADPRVPVEKRIAAEQAFVNQNIQLQQKQFSDWIQVQQLQTSQGQLSVSQQEVALKYWQNAHPDAKVTLSGGEIITQDPRTGQEIAPRVQVNPERSNKVGGVAKWDGKQWVQAMPNEASAVPGEWIYAGGKKVDFQPAPSVPAQGNYDIAIKDLDKDRGEIAAIGDAGRAAQQDNLRVQEMRDILEHADTGPGTETAAHLRAWIARWTPGELSKWDGNAGNLSGPAAVEMFQKLGFVGAVTQERGSTPRGGYQATKMFQQFNPGAQMLTSTNQGLLAQRLIANQAETDYAQGAQDHYNTQHQRLKSPERDYDPLSSFDAKWQAQRNPQVYAAAIGALGGQDPEMWSRGLSKDEIQRVKDVVTRADPNAVINMPGEGRVVVQPNAKPLPPGFKVQ